MVTTLRTVLSCSCLLLAAACSSDTKTATKNDKSMDDGGGKPSENDGGGGVTTDDWPVVGKEWDCDKTQRPFVFVHGTYGSGDNFAHVASLLTSNGFCPENIVAVEYNSLGEQPGANCTSANMPKGCGNIDKVVDAILAK